MLRIDVASLKPGSHRLDVRPSAEALDLDAAVFRDIAVALRLDVQPGRVLVRLKAEAIATLECDRTLVLFDRPIEGRYTVLYAAPALVAELEPAHDDVRPLLPSDQEIDLTDVVRDTLMLAVPVRKVAPGAEEVALPLRFGDEGGVDPRWEALRRLRPGDEVNEG
ncbi:DUF177 domain-containing protein [Rhodocaloribacter litoris]|uniref:YceD family protein n=1 Tax=Rhodocaloribacter litoris TaxID=2558931 RepID=UPI00141E0962|nr:DUF177 domain-containing protein [Rhodocaloribacter litoris]QXD13741.1 DUF177 domain-containing protein [Rhodocaloribacter litoris]